MMLKKRVLLNKFYYVKDSYSGVFFMIAYSTIILLISGFIFTQQYPIAKFKQLRARDLTLYWHIFTWGLVFAGFSVFLVKQSDGAFQFTEFYDQREKTLFRNMNIRKSCFDHLHMRSRSEGIQLGHF